MSEAAKKCACIVDTDGLLAISGATGNERAVLISQLEDGTIAVPARAWREFESLYEDEAEQLKPHVTAKISGGQVYDIVAASIADKMNSTFPRGGYDLNVELLIAAISTKHRKPILTSQSQSGVYMQMGCDVSDLSAWMGG